MDTERKHRPRKRPLRQVNKAIRAARILREFGFYLYVPGCYFIQDDQDVTEFARDPYQFYLDHRDEHFANRMDWLERKRK